MKKLLLISIIMLSAICYADAQKTGTLKAVDPAGSWLHNASLGSSDTIGSGDSTWYYNIIPNKGERLYYDIYLDVDSIGGTGGVADLCPFILQGRRLSVDTWTNIDTVTYTGTVDTTFKFTQVATASFYTEFRVTVTAANDSFAAQISSLIARFWY